jgi:hypothetical protein
MKVFEQSPGVLLDREHGWSNSTRAYPDDRPFAIEVARSRIK